MFDSEIVTQGIELAGRDTRLHVGRDEVEHLGRQASGFPHAFIVVRAMELDPGQFGVKQRRRLRTRIAHRSLPHAYPSSNVTGRCPETSIPSVATTQS